MLKFNAKNNNTPCYSYTTISAAQKPYKANST